MGPPRAEQIAEGLRLLAHEVPVETGTTPRDVVWTRNKTTLTRYRPLAPLAHPVPVLLVYALVNKPYVLDLRPESSLVRHLLLRGHDVWLLDWGTPGWEDRGVTLDELVGDHLPRAITRMRRASDPTAGGDYTLLGYCMGGTMAAMHAARRPPGLRNLVALTTPIDFAHASPDAFWTDPRRLDASALAAALGNVPAALIDAGNKMAQPGESLRGAQATMWQRLLAGRDLTSWVALDKWVNDGVPFPGAAFVEWVEGYYQQNRLVRGAATIGGERIDLGRITASLLAIVGARDHIVPPAMARPLLDLVASPDRELVELPAGHVGLLVGAGARATLWPRLTAWLAARSGAAAAR